MFSLFLLLKIKYFQNGAKYLTSRQDSRSKCQIAASRRSCLRHQACRSHSRDGAARSWRARAMRTVLCVAEKNSAARAIADVMCAIRGVQKQTRAGRNPVFTFPYVVDGAEVTVLFTAVAGHIKATQFDTQSDSWGRRPHIDLLDTSKSSVSWEVMEDKQDLAQHLRDVARAAHMLVLWLDCDSEGEKIAQDVADVCRKQKPSLAVRRARFSAMTRPEVETAWRTLGAINPAVVSMVEVRQELDHRAGYAFTRFLSDRSKHFALPANTASGEHTVVSYGPCQSPALGLVVDRQLTIDNFQRRPFWVFRLRLRGCDCPFDWARHRVYEEYGAHVLYELCVEDSAALGDCARVERVDSQRRSRMRPTPLSTIELQKAASRLLRISSDRSVKAAEALYASGHISYPRTETDEFEPSYDLRGFVEMQAGHAQWGQFASRLLSPATENDPVSFNWPRSGGNNDHAHPPIHPTAPPPASFPDNDQKMVYEYVARRFLAACSTDAQGFETKVQVRAGRAEMFGCRGLIVQVRGYLEVMRYDKWTDRAMPTQLLEVGATLPISELTMQKSETQPPPLLSEADLIALMDRHGIGTDATIAQHVEKILNRGYVCRQGDARFKPNPLGMALVESLERSGVQLARPGMRKAQEADFKKVMAGKAVPANVKLEALAQFRTNFELLLGNTAAVSAAFGSYFGMSASEDVSRWSTAHASFSICGKCGRMMALKAKTVGTNKTWALRCVHCHAAPSYVLARNTSTSQFTAAQGAGHICPICKFQVVSVSNRSTGAKHTLCPFCMHHPPQDRAVNRQDELPGRFRCFMCSHAACPNATGLSPSHSGVAKCPDSGCRESCDIKTSNRDGRVRLFIACSSPKDGPCRWRPYFFPDSIESVVAQDGQDGVCQLCSSKKLVVKCKRSAVPVHVEGTFAGCIWCDQSYRALLNSIGDVARAPGFPHPGAPAAADLEGYGRGRGRGARGQAIRARGVTAQGRVNDTGNTWSATRGGRESWRGNQRQRGTGGRAAPRRL